jgi:hypothetical protein
MASIAAERKLNSDARDMNGAALIKAKCRSTQLADRSDYRERASLSPLGKLLGPCDSFRPMNSEGLRHTEEFEVVIMIAGADRRDAWVGPSPDLNREEERDTQSITRLFVPLRNLAFLTGNPGWQREYICIRRNSISAWADTAKREAQSTSGLSLDDN